MKLERRKPNYERKAKVIENGLVAVQKQVSRAEYAQKQLVNYGVVVKTKLTFEEARRVYIDQTNANPEDWFEAERVNHAKYARDKRLERRIENMLQKGQCIFLTLTFTDETLNSTTAETRRKYVRRYLQSQSPEYVANIDFGAQNDREHYHAVILADKVDFEPWRINGNINGEKVRYKPPAEENETSEDAVKLGKYVSKLTNHAIKNTTKRNSIIYSRPKKEVQKDV